MKRVPFGDGEEYGPEKGRRRISTTDSNLVHIEPWEPHHVENTGDVHVEGIDGFALGRPIDVRTDPE